MTIEAYNDFYDFLVESYNDELLSEEKFDNLNSSAYNKFIIENAEDVLRAYTEDYDSMDINDVYKAAIEKGEEEIADAYSDGAITYFEARHFSKILKGEEKKKAAELRKEWEEAEKKYHDEKQKLQDEEIAALKKEAKRRKMKETVGTVAKSAAALGIGTAVGYGMYQRGKGIKANSLKAVDDQLNAMPKRKNKLNASYNKKKDEVQKSLRKEHQDKFHNAINTDEAKKKRRKTPKKYDKWKEETRKEIFDDYNNKLSEKYKQLEKAGKVKAAELNDEEAKLKARRKELAKQKIFIKRPDEIKGDGPKLDTKAAKKALKKYILG